MEDYSTYAPWIIMAVNGLVAGWLAQAGGTPLAFGFALWQQSQVRNFRRSE